MDPSSATIKIRPAGFLGPNKIIAGRQRRCKWGDEQYEKNNPFIALGLSDNNNNNNSDSDSDSDSDNNNSRDRPTTFPDEETSRTELEELEPKT